MFVTRPASALAAEVLRLARGAERREADAHVLERVQPTARVRLAARVQRVAQPRRQLHPHAARVVLHRRVRALRLAQLEQLPAHLGHLAIAVDAL